MNEQPLRNPIIPQTEYQDSVSFFEGFVPTLVTWFLVAGSVLFVFMFIIGAIQMILAGGDKGAVEQAKGRLSSALIGIVILFSTFAVATLVEVFFGINLLTIDIGSLKIQ